MAFEKVRGSRFCARHRRGGCVKGKGQRGGKKVVEGNQQTFLRDRGKKKKHLNKAKKNGRAGTDQREVSGEQTLGSKEITYSNGGMRCKHRTDLDRKEKAGRKTETGKRD